MRTRRARTYSTSLSPLDRTRLMIGIVMIPLAASCVFASGVYSQRLVTETQTPQRSIVEVRAIYSERRGSDSAEELAATEGEMDEAQARLHSPGGPQAALPAAAPQPRPLPFSLTFLREEPLTAVSPPRLTRPSRGPPHVI